MKICKKYLAVFFFSSIFIASPFLCLAQTAQYNFEKIFYLARYNIVSGVDSLSKNWDKIDIIAPQMYVVNPNFTVTGGFGPKLKQLIKDHNLKVMPLVANAGFNQITIHKFLTSTDGQNNVINFLVATAKSQKYIGWQFDFEHISYLDKDLFTAFIQRAYPVFQKNDLVLSVAVISRTSDYEDTDAFKNWGGAYDYQKIADSSDFVTLMAYDDANSKGPSASIDFVNNALSYLKDKVPPQKLSLGVPLYSWVWSQTADKKIGACSYKNILSVEANNRCNLGFDQNFGVSWIDYSVKNKEYKIWVEDKQSLEQKLNIAKNNNLRGFSAWLLGAEDPAIWSIFDKNIK